MAAARVATGRAGAGEVLATAIGGLGEFAADHAAATVFARCGKGAAIAAIAPFIGAADFAVQAVGIDAKRHGLVLAIDVAADDIAQQAAQHHAAHDRAAIAAAGRAADQAAGQRAEDGAGGGIAAAAALFITALLIIVLRRRRRRRAIAAIRRAIVAVAAIADAAVTPVAIVI